MGAISYNAVEFFDRDFGPYMVSVTPPGPGVSISPSSPTLKELSLGRAPGKLTASGWVGIDLRDPKSRCLDFKTAKLWTEVWGANVGFVAGDDGYVILDNDQGTEFTEVLIERFVKLGVDPLRRYVLDPKHHRDAFLVRVLDFIGDPVKLKSQDFVFRNGNLVGKFQILAAGKQAVISGTHRETKAPYVWERTIDNIQDVPVLSEDQFGIFFQMFTAKLQERGWSPTRSGHLVPPVNLVSQGARQSPYTQKPHHKLSSGEVDALIQGAKDLLDQIPNRDVPPGETPNAIDQWLDPYENWITVAYDLAAYLGDAAQTAEAEDLFTEWSDGRTQVRQKSRSLWVSVIRQPLRSGISALPSLVRSLTPREVGFPPLDPNDPALVKPLWDKLRKEWALFTPRSYFLDVRTGKIVTRQAFSDIHADQALALTHELRPRHKKKNRTPQAADLFVEQTDKPMAEALTYAPGEPPFIEEPGSTFPIFNKWRSASLTVPATPITDKDIQPWRDHVEFVTGSVTERDRFIEWSAFVVQFPEEKPNWHFLIQSLQGIGKDTMVEPLKVAVGRNNCKEGELSHLAGDFNDGAEAKLIVISEVGQPKSREAHKVDTVLKQVLSKPPNEIWINQKNLPRYAIPNRLAAILFSNEATPLSLERDQRRLNVLNCRNIQPKPQSYYQDLWDWLKKGGSQMVAVYLHAYPLSAASKQDFIGGVAPDSVAKAQLEQQSVDPGLDALEEIIADARNGSGAFTALVATADQLAEHVGFKTRKPSPQMVRGWLLDMENRNTGVRRLRIDPKAPALCGVFSDRKRGISARLWALAEQTADGRDWKALSNPEVIALWRGEKGPPNATVLSFPATAKGDEPI